MNRKRMQRLLAAGLSAALALSLSACGGGATAAQNDNTTAAPSGESTGAAQPADYGNILIAYFTADENTEPDAVSSASVTEIGGEEVGRVRAVADMIAAETGGELFSIQTSVEYPEDGGALIDYAAEEQDQNARPELTSHIENLDDYDTIFIGYPQLVGRYADGAVQLFRRVRLCGQDHHPVQRPQRQPLFAHDRDHSGAGTRGNCHRGRLHGQRT